MPDASQFNEYAIERPPNQCARVTVERYGSRHWAVFEDGELLCVTVYKKGAQAVANRLQTAPSVRALAKTAM